MKGFRLVETPKPEDLEEVIYWIRENGRAWPTDEDNTPLQDNGTPFRIDEDGLIGNPDILPDIDPQETEEGIVEPITMVIEPELEPLRLVFRLKMLLGRDHNEITQMITKTKTKAIARKRNRQPIVEVESDVDLNLAVNLKLMKAIVEWEGILDENGSPAPITEKYIELLPAWLQNSLTDRIEDMSSLDGEEVGE